MLRAKRRFLEFVIVALTCTLTFLLRLVMCVELSSISCVILTACPGTFLGFSTCESQFYFHVFVSV